MAIKNKHIYANITEKNIETQYTFKTDPHYETVKAYKVEFITEYDLVIFGKAFHKVKTEEIPFLFKTLEMAKDFCEVKPNYEIYVIKNDKDDVQYNTYRLSISENNEFIGYIWWDGNSVIITDTHCYMTFDFDKQPIVFGFIKNMWLNDWEDTHGLRNIKYYNFSDNLSKLMPIKEEKPKEKQWRFELIAQAQ